METMRCFVGIELPDCMAEPLIHAAEVMRSADHSWRDEKWVRPENLHVTVAFLGGIPASDIDALSAAVGAAACSNGSFVLPFSGVRAIPNAGRARMIWGAFLDPDGRFAFLVESIERACIPFGVTPDTRAPRPHVTMCRARRPKNLSERALEAADAVTAAAPKSMSLPSATLFSSRLTPRGPVYETIGAWHLRGE